MQATQQRPQIGDVWGDEKVPSEWRFVMNVDDSRVIFDEFGVDHYPEYGESMKEWMAWASDKTKINEKPTSAKFAKFFALLTDQERIDMLDPYCRECGVPLDSLPNGRCWCACDY